MMCIKYLPSENNDSLLYTVADDRFQREKKTSKKQRQKLRYY